MIYREISLLFTSGANWKRLRPVEEQDLYERLQAAGDWRAAGMIPGESPGAYRIMPVRSTAP
jgi:hypothetical protein